MIVDYIETVPVGAGVFSEDPAYMDLGINVPIGVNS